MSEHAEHDDSHYIKVWAILLVLLLISFVGPMVGIQWLTLATAFGIAIVKAYLVAVNFMHINATPRFVVYLVATTLVFMLLFFAGTAPDVMKHSGTNWIKPDWVEAERAYEAGEVSGLADHGEDHTESTGDGSDEHH